MVNQKTVEYQRAYYQKRKAGIRLQRVAKSKKWRETNKQAVAKYNREYYLQNTEKINKKSKAWHVNNRDKALVSARISKTKQRRLAYEFVNFVKIYLGCTDCKISSEHILQLHHVDGLKKKTNISTMTGSGYCIKSIKQEMKKCIVLCANCHILRHASEKTGNFRKSL